MHEEYLNRIRSTEIPPWKTGNTVTCTCYSVTVFLPLWCCSGGNARTKSSIQGDLKIVSHVFCATRLAGGCKDWFGSFDSEAAFRRIYFSAIHSTGCIARWTVISAARFPKLTSAQNVFCLVNVVFVGKQMNLLLVFGWLVINILTIVNNLYQLL